MVEELTPLQIAQQESEQRITAGAVAVQAAIAKLHAGEQAEVLARVHAKIQEIRNEIHERQELARLKAKFGGA